MSVSTITSTTIISNMKAGEEDEISYKKLNKLYFLFISPFKCVSIENFVPNEKMFNITHYQRNANQNHNEVPSHAIRMAAIQKSRSNKCWRGCGEKATLLHCWWECKLVQPLWRTVWRFLKKLEIELPYDPAIPLLGIHNEEIRIERDTCTPMFITALFIIARTWKQLRCPSADKRIRKLCTYIQWNITQPLKRMHLNQF